MRYRAVVDTRMVVVVMIVVMCCYPAVINAAAVVKTEVRFRVTFDSRAVMN